MRHSHITFGVLALAALGSLNMAIAIENPRKAAGFDLTVTVTDIKGDEGELIISLFTKPDGFPADHKKAIKSQTIKLDEPEWTFSDLPEGKYVIVVVQDRNKNGKVDRSAIGFPLEPIGLSNHREIGPKGGPPNFNKAKVDVNQDTAVKINLIEVGK
jgi:uncharacterized protein (DUF2141 family)